MMWEVWRQNDKAITLGAVLETPFKAELTHEYSSDILRPDSQKLEESVKNATLDMPMSYGIGLAFRFSDELTLSADVYRTEWDDYIFTDSKRRRISPVTSGNPDDIDPTHQVRLGAEYLYIITKGIIPLRGGIFYDPAPAEGSPDDFFGFSIGTGLVMDTPEYTRIKGFSFDIAYQYRYGNNVGSSILKELSFSQDVEEHTMYSSVIIYF